MKKRKLLLLILYSVLEIVVLNAQSDLQWYIVDGKGKTGISMAGNNTYGVTNIDNRFVISKVGLYSVDSNRNDIFIIFEDGSHFNSRLLPNNWYIEALNDSMQYYKFPQKPIYLYYTNLYEGEDDPPSRISVDNTSITIQNYQDIAGIDQPKTIYANHDIVLNKDITLIIKKPSFELRGEGVNTKDTPDTYKLYFENTILTPSNVFNGNNFVYPAASGSYSGSGNVVLLDFSNVTDYLYLNFNTYSLGAKSIDSLVTFELKTNDDQFVTSHTEFIRQSHDPNYIEVLNIFEKKPGEYWAHMHVQCYNDSREAHVNDAQLALTMPSTVDAASLEMTDWSYGMTQGDLPDVTMKKKGDRIYFNFGAVPDILNMQGPDYYYVDPSQVAWVEYIVKINSNNPAEVAKINLKPLRPMTFFDGTPYDITRYIDRCFGNLSDRTDLCERKIMGSYYMGQFTETMALGSHTTSEAYSGSEENQNCCKHQCSKDRCKNDCDKNQCKDKCCKKKKRFWKNVIPWVIAGVMTVIAIAD